MAFSQPAPSRACKWSRMLGSGPRRPWSGKRSANAYLCTVARARPVSRLMRRSDCPAARRGRTSSWSASHRPTAAARASASAGGPGYVLVRRVEDTGAMTGGNGSRRGWTGASQRSTICRVLSSRCHRSAPSPRVGAPSVIHVRIRSSGRVPRAGSAARAGARRPASRPSGRAAVRQPHRRVVPVHHRAHHRGGPCRRGLVHHRLGAAEDPVRAVAALDPDAGFIRGHHTRVKPESRLPARRRAETAVSRPPAKRCCPRRSRFINPPWLSVSPNRSDNAPCSRS